ncbi:thiamine diphosphokinase [[Clostridium] colinum]|uniref:thiamine diphosphokinase n=1 Tax=[Clostridium] colinum TaxID=36835 RepID=UPI002024099B|nr:thiamine diphosphokinase [[Clostridium] colinum]
MRALIIASGDIKNSIQDILKPSDIIICCDGGSKYLFEEGIIPHYIIGDLDSSIPQIIQFFETKNVIFKKFDTKKDETDMELCIDFSISLGIDEIVILGGTGTRLDHTLTNINLLKKAEDANIKATIIDKNNQINITSSTVNIKGKKGDLLSLIPLTTTVEGISTTGLEYPLDNATMYIGKSLGVSNVMEDENVNISIKNGYLLIIKSID